MDRLVMPRHLPRPSATAHRPVTGRSGITVTVTLIDKHPLPRPRYASLQISCEKFSRLIADRTSSLCPKSDPISRQSTSHSTDKTLHRRNTLCGSNRALFRPALSPRDDDFNHPGLPVVLHSRPRHGVREDRHRRDGAVLQLFSAHRWQPRNHLRCLSASDE